MSVDRRIFATLALALGVVALTGCGRSLTYDHTPVTAGYHVAFSDMEYALINVWTDPVTGCDYFLTDDGFMSPRLMPDGRQLCRAKKVPAPSAAAGTGAP